MITEGLLAYLAPKQVNELAAQLRRDANTRWWVAVLITALLQRTGYLGFSAQPCDAAFRFAPVDAKACFRELKWMEAEFHSTAWVESRRTR